MLIKFSSVDRTEKTVGSTGTVLENLLRQVKEERDNTTQTHSCTQPLTYTNTHPGIHTLRETLIQFTELFKHFTFKQEKVNTYCVYSKVFYSILEGTYW